MHCNVTLFFNITLPIVIDTSACLLCNEIFWGWPGGGRTRGYPRLATLQWNILRWPAGRSPCGKKTKIRQPWHFMRPSWFYSGCRELSEVANRVIQVVMWLWLSSKDSPDRIGHTLKIYMFGETQIRNLRHQQHLLSKMYTCRWRGRGWQELRRSNSEVCSLWWQVGESWNNEE